MWIPVQKTLTSLLRQPDSYQSYKRACLFKAEYVLLSWGNSEKWTFTSRSEVILYDGMI